MKRLRKLLGILLTGVMALTLLAGCAGTASLNEKEILATIKDYYKLEYPAYEVSDDTTNYAKKTAAAIKDYYSESDNNPDISVEYLVHYLNSSSSDFDQIKQAVIPDDSTDTFTFACATVEQYTTPYMQEHQNALLAQDLFSYFRMASGPISPVVKNKAFFSVSTETIDGETYIFLVARKTAA